MVMLIDSTMVTATRFEGSVAALIDSVTCGINFIENRSKLTTTARPPQRFTGLRILCRHRSGYGSRSSSPASAIPSSAVSEPLSQWIRQPVMPPGDVLGNAKEVFTPLPKKNDELTEEIIKLVSKRNDEPEWMLQFRLNALNQWLSMQEPKELQRASPSIGSKTVHKFASRIFQRNENSFTSSQRAFSFDVDTTVNSDSFATAHQEELAKAGVIFCSISEAIKMYPELVQKYLGKVAPSSENYFVALNSAIFTHGSFCYVPRNTICPVDISTHFLKDGRKVRNLFERNLIICEEGSYVSSLGCTSPSPDIDATEQLSAPVIELFCAEGAEIKYFDINNWQDAGASQSPVQTQVYYFPTQRGLCDGPRSKITWISVELGSTIASHYPTVVLKGNGSVGHGFSVTITNSGQFADLGARIIHIGSNTKSHVVSKSVHAGNSYGCFRFDIEVHPPAQNAHSELTWDAILLGPHAKAESCPFASVRNSSAQIKLEGGTSRVDGDKVFYLQQRGIQCEEAVQAILTGFCSDAIPKLPFEFEEEVREIVKLKISEAMKS